MPDTAQTFEEQQMDRYDREIKLDTGTGPVLFKVSFLPVVQAIVYTGIDGRCGEIHLTRPFASKTPADHLLTTEILHHMDSQELNQSETEEVIEYDS